MSCECEKCGKVSIISNITLCEDCYRKEIEASKKQGALEELKKIQRMNHRDWKTGNTTLANQYSKIMNKIDKRIKELSGETK